MFSLTPGGEARQDQLMENMAIFSKHFSLNPELRRHYIDIDQHNIHVLVWNGSSFCTFFFLFILLSGENNIVWFEKASLHTAWGCIK